MAMLGFVAVVTGCAAAAPPAEDATRPPETGGPPAVHVGEADLYCDIDATKNGIQRLVLQSGGGIEFDAVVSPIVDGTVALKGPDKGGNYKFTSHLAQPAKGSISGVGEVEISRLETSVSVSVDRYSQEGGPGTAFSFTSADMARRGIYVEFIGAAVSKTGEEYMFRVNFGSATSGSGKVKPATANDQAPIASKMVTFAAPTTAVIQTTVRRVR